MDPSSAAITAAAWVWDKYGEALTGKTADAAKKGWEKFGWKRAAEKYRAKIKKLYGTMQIMGMARPVPLDDIFTDAYMLDKPTAFGRFDIEQLKRLSADPDKPPEQAVRVNGLRLVREKGNLFILGKPGAGKTTFLKYIALQAAEQNIDKIPLFVSLKEWAHSGTELMAFITDRFDICDFPDARPFVEELLKSGSAVVLFDGLDEVNQDGGLRHKQTRGITNFVEKYDRTQCLITCRTAASSYFFNPFTYVEVADFTPGQIERFVGNWFRDQEGKKDWKTCTEFLTEFAKADNRGVRELAHTPLLLTLLCLSFEGRLTFPQRRADIYEDALDALLTKWDSSRLILRDEAYRKLSLGHKVRLLARIAAETFEGGEYFIPQKELERRINNYVESVLPRGTDGAGDGEAILKAIEVQHGIFVERAHKVYSFSHLTFQEYFTARYVVDNAAPGTLAELVKAHCANVRWREVFLLTASLLPDASQFMMLFRSRVDELLEGDSRLSALLVWADRKSSSTQIGSWKGRMFYLFTEIFYTNRDFNLADDFQGDLSPNPDLDLALDHALARILDGARAFTFKRGRDRGLAGVLSFNSALELACIMGLHQFVRELDELYIPGRRTSVAAWRQFVGELRALMRKHRSLGYEWRFTAAQEKRLTDYLNATRLLRDCLELTFMPQDVKEAMLDSLCLPPSQASKWRSV